MIKSLKKQGRKNGQRIKRMKFFHFGCIIKAPTPATVRGRSDQQKDCPKGQTHILILNTNIVPEEGGLPQTQSEHPSD